MENKLDKDLLASRFMPSGLNSHFDIQNVSFDQYLLRMRDIIRLCRVDLTPDTQEKIINANAPFEIKPTNPRRTGILLLAGLYDCPHSLKHIGKQLAKENFWVRSILNPGHGTIPGDLLEVTKEDWIAAALFGLNSFQDCVEQVIIVGFSTGAAISLQLALHSKHMPIAGLVMLAPCIGIHNKMAQYAKWLQKAQTLSGRLGWLTQAKDDDYTRYHSMTFNSISQVHDLTELNKNETKQQPLSCPVFMALSDDDIVIDNQDALDWLEKQHHAHDTLIYFSQDKPSYTLPKQKTILISSDWTDHLAGVSHKGLPIPADCSHYGIDGDYQHACALESSFWKHIPESLISKKSQLNRLRIELTAQAFNPGHTQMMQALQTFVTKVCNK